MSHPIPPMLRTSCPEGLQTHLCRVSRLMPKPPKTASRSWKLLEGCQNALFPGHEKIYRPGLGEFDVSASPRKLTTPISFSEPELSGSKKRLRGVVANFICKACLHDLACMPLRFRGTILLRGESTRITRTYSKQYAVDPLTSRGLR